jgi:hypothetical protein
MRWRTSHSVTLASKAGKELIRIDCSGIKIRGILTDNGQLIINTFLHWLGNEALVDITSPRKSNKNWMNDLKQSLYPAKEKVLEIVINSTTVMIFKYNGDIILKGKKIGNNCAVYDGIKEVLSLSWNI